MRWRASSLSLRRSFLLFIILSGKNPSLPLFRPDAGQSLATAAREARRGRKASRRVGQRSERPAAAAPIISSLERRSPSSFEFAHTLSHSSPSPSQTSVLHSFSKFRFSIDRQPAQTFYLAKSSLVRVPCWRLLASCPPVASSSVAAAPSSSSLRHCCCDLFT